MNKAPCIFGNRGGVIGYSVKHLLVCFISLFLFFVSVSYSQVKRDAAPQKSTIDVAKYSLIARSVLNIDSNMVLVKGGSFEMGLPDTSTVEGASFQQPMHKVKLNSFYISKYEVTEALWIAVMDTGTPTRDGCNTCPVGDVSWNEAQLFIGKINALTKYHYRLPTEAEWEYAAKGGAKSHGYLFSGSNYIDEVAWYYKLGGSHPVGLKKPNELGLFDMTGNISEWCSDWFGKYPDAVQDNPQGAATGAMKILRGGNWLVRDEGCTNTIRGASPPGFHDKTTGLRLARDAQ